MTRDRSSVERARAALAPRIRWVLHHVKSFYAAAGLVLSAGLVLALIGLWLLSGLTEEVLEGETIRMDSAVLRWLHGYAAPWLDQAALEITALGNTLVVLTLAVAAGSLLWILGRRAYATLLAAAVGGAAILNPLLKLLFERPRPGIFEWRSGYTTTSSAYPSGHAMLAMVTLVVLAFIIHRLSSRIWVGVAAIGVAGVLILLIGLSRLYIGVHFPSDVLAGYATGFAWAVFCALTLQLLQRRAETPAVDRTSGAPSD